MEARTEAGLFHLDPRSFFSSFLSPSYKPPHSDVLLSCTHIMCVHACACTHMCAPQPILQPHHLPHNCMCPHHKRTQCGSTSSCFGVRLTWIQVLPRHLLALPSPVSHSTFLEPQKICRPERGRAPVSPRVAVERED